MPVIVRDDLAEAHRLAWEHVAAPGTWWTGVERVELAGTALLAITDADPLPPWIGVTSTDRLGAGRAVPPVADDVAYRLARHAGTMTRHVYDAAVAELGELPYVELCAIVSTVAAVAHFCRNIGVEVPPLPAPAEVSRRDRGPNVWRPRGSTGSRSPSRPTRWRRWSRRTPQFPRSTGTPGAWVTPSTCRRTK